MSPIGDDECLFSSFAPNIYVSVISLAIRRAIPEMSKLPQDRPTYLAVRDLDATAVGRVLLATFETQQHPVELRTNFYLCTNVQQRPGGLSRLTLSNVTRDHHSPPATCRGAIRWIFPSVATEIAWIGPMTSDGVAPVLHSLFDQPGFASPPSKA